MSKTVLIVGGGRVGRHVAEQLSEERNTVTIVERDEEKVEQVSSVVSRVVHGDGTDEDTLAEAELSEATVVAALTNDTETNLTICELAAEHAPAATTLLRIARDGEQDYGYRSFVDQVVYPAAAGAAEAAEQIASIPTE